MRTRSQCASHQCDPKLSGSYTFIGHKMSFMVYSPGRYRCLTTPGEAPMLRIVFSDHDIAQLRYARSHHPHPRVQQKMEALPFKSQGLPHHVLAGCVGSCENTVLG